MQFSVPQFTDVEDKLVAGLTFKQFGIVFGAGILVFVVYTISKNLVATIAASLLLGLPAVMVAFGRVNGRAVYTSFGPLVSHLMGGKLYVFQKQALTVNRDRMELEVAAPVVSVVQDNPVAQLKKLGYVLQQQAEQKQELVDRIETERRMQSRR